jgi:hypothetical protein
MSILKIIQTEILEIAFLDEGAAAGVANHLSAKDAAASVVSRALSLASITAPKVPPSIPPPTKPVVIGESAQPFGAHLVACPCRSASDACQPSPTQRLPCCRTQLSSGLPALRLHAV